MTDHKPCDLCQTTHNLAGDSADTLASEILEAHCTCYAKVWPGHTAANASHAVARKIREALGVRVFDRAALAKTKDRLDAALAQVARLRGALEIIVGCFDAAVIEGLYDRMAEQDNQDPGSLHGIIARRILHAEPVARAALTETADTPAPVLADDGWTAWEGGECPVADGAVVEVRYRDTRTARLYSPRQFRWRHEQNMFDFVAYRIEEARDA